MEANHSKYWMDLGVCEDGNHYGIPWFPNFKSIVFYHEPTFTANGYEIPETYEDMVALSEQIVADGLELLEVAWWVSAVPGLAILATVLGLNLFGDWLRDYLDPRSRRSRMT